MTYSEHSLYVRQGLKYFSLCIISLNPHETLGRQEVSLVPHHLWANLPRSHRLSVAEQGFKAASLGPLAPVTMVYCLVHVKCLE